MSAAKKGFTVKYKKQATQTTGYQIQYATDKNFKKNKKTVTVKKNKTTSVKVKKLKAKKKYYVRVRTYKNVKDADGTPKNSTPLGLKLRQLKPKSNIQKILVPTRSKDFYFCKRKLPTKKSGVKL